MGLRTRVLVGLALVALVLVVGSVAIARMTAADLVAQVDAQLAGASRRGAPGPGTGRGPGEQPLTPLYQATVWPDGTVQVWAVPNLVGDQIALPVADYATFRARAKTGGAVTVASDDGSVRYRVQVFEGRPAGGRGSGPVLHVVALPLDSVDAAVARLITLQALVTASVLAVLGLVGWWVVHLGVRPVKGMTAAASAIAAGDLSARVPAADPRTEAGELGHALNVMLSRIEAAFDERRATEERLRRFAADASHELRTPIATIRGYAELYRAGALGDRAELDDAMRRTEQEALRMSRLVDDLLLLARLDQGRPLEQGPVDLAALVADAVADARAVAPYRPVTAVVVPGGGPVVTGDEGRLRQVLANVVGNAVTHTDDDVAVTVTVGLDTGGHHAVVTVADEGPGVAPEVAERAFERFFRADPSRSRHRGGSGLGLAIVAAIVGAHGGSVAFESAPGRGTTVRIELPVGGRSGEAPGGLSARSQEGTPP